MKIPAIVIIVAVLWAMGSQMPITAKHTARAYLNEAVDTAAGLLYR